MTKWKDVLIVTSAGGPAATNFIKSIRMEYPVTIWGTDYNKYMLALSGELYRKFIVPHAGLQTSKWLMTLRKIWKKWGCDMLVPISDTEIYFASKFRSRLPSMILPPHKIIELCQDKAAFYQFLQNKGFPVPDFKIMTQENRIALLRHFGPNWGFGKDWNYPYWLRATHGAGGHRGFKVDDVYDLRRIVGYYLEKDYIHWMLSKYLEGDDYCWTSIWNNGELITSVTKKRIQWVYGRIGTTAVQKTVHRNDINSYCYKVVSSLSKKLSGIMMIDLKCDENDKPFITEINAGRLGTVNEFFAEASYKTYEDHRTNFAALLFDIHNDLDLPKTKQFDALPEGLYWIRHIDMGAKLVTEEWLRHFTSGL